MRFPPITLIATALTLAACSPGGGDAGAPPPAAKPPQPIEVVTVDRHDLIDAITLVGTVEARESAQIHPELAGIVQKILFREGQTVRRGEVLLKIDDSELRVQADQAEAAFRLASQTLERVNNLRPTRSLPESEYDRVQAEFESARAALELVRNRLAKTEIRAPFAGTVGARTVSPGDYVTTATTITSVDDLARLKVSFEVPERYLNQVSPGTAFSVRSDALAAQAPIGGKVYFVSASINRSTRSSQVKGLLDTAALGLRPGMFANIELVLDVRQQVLAVPEAAVFSTVDGPQLVVARAVDERFEAVFVPVQLGLRQEGLVEVQSQEPLEGRLVAAAGVGALALYPGTPLDPRPAAGSYGPLSHY